MNAHVTMRRGTFKADVDGVRHGGPGWVLGVTVKADFVFAAAALSFEKFGELLFCWRRLFRHTVDLIYASRDEALGCGRT